MSSTRPTPVTATAVTTSSMPAASVAGATSTVGTAATAAPQTPPAAFFTRLPLATKILSIGLVGLLGRLLLLLSTWLGSTSMSSA